MICGRMHFIFKHKGHEGKTQRKHKDTEVETIYKIRGKISFHLRESAFHF